MERELTVRHVLVGFVERQESGIRNAECGIRNPFKCHLLEDIVYFYPFFFISRSSIRITMIISSLTLQDIKQNVSETLADKQQTTRYSSILQLLNRSQTFSTHPVSTVSSATEC